MDMFGGKVGIPQKADKRVRDYFSEIGRGIENRESLMEEWKENERAAYSEQSPEYSTDEPKVNKLASFMESRIAAIAYRNPRVRLMPRNAHGWEPVDVPVIDPNTGPVMEQQMDPMTGMVREVPKMRRIPRCKVAENLVNYMLDQHDFRAAASGRLVVHQGILAGISGMKVGYVPQYDPPEELAEPIAAEDAVFMDPADLRELYEMGPQGQPMIDQDGMLVPKGSLPIGDQWFIDWVDVKRVIFDPDGENNFADHSWVAYEHIAPLEDVKANPLYKNTKNLGPTGTQKAYLHDSAGTVSGYYGASKYASFEGSGDKKLVRLFEVWDFRRGRLVVIADGHDKLLRDDEIPDGVSAKTGPFAWYRPFEKAGAWYGHCPATDLRKLNKFYDEANRQAMEEMRKSTAKVVLDGSFFDANDVGRMRSPEREVILIPEDKVGNKNIKDAVHSVTYPTVAPQMFEYAKFIAMNFDEEAGQPGESRGVASADTATQVQALTNREDLRENYQRGIYAEMWREALKKLLDSIQANMTTEQAMTVVGGDGTAYMTMVDPEMIQGDFDVKVEVTDLEPMSRAQDRANFVQAMTVIAQALPLVADEQAAQGIFELFGVTDQRIASGISKMAQMQMQMAMMPRQPATPSTGPAQSDSQAISQQGGQM